MILIFSKDRAFQLEACLRSLLGCAQDARDHAIFVLWTASTALHEESYQMLIAEYAPQTNLIFVRERSFRADTLSILGGIRRGSFTERLIYAIEGKSRTKPTFAQKIVTGLFLRPSESVLFAVDDTIFLKPFHVRQLMSRLEAAPTTLALSLRLGDHIDFFYMGNRSQQVPKLQPVSAAPELAAYQWPEADGDFGYPLEISSSLLKPRLFLKRLLRKPWKSPNTLEMALANMSGRYKKEYPEVITFRTARAVSVPLNIVQKDFAENRFATGAGKSAEELCDLFLRGKRANLAALGAETPRSVHAELNLLPDNTGSQAANRAG